MKTKTQAKKTDTKLGKKEQYDEAERKAIEVVNKLVKNRNISYIFFTALTLERGNDLLKQIRVTPNKTIGYQGYQLTLPIRLNSIKIDRCSCCGKPVDSYAVIQEVRQVVMDYEIYRLVPIIDGQVVNCDHLVPQALGGRKAHVENLRATCWACNVVKAHMMEDSDFEAVAGRWEKLTNLKEFKTIAKKRIADYNKKRSNPDTSKKLLRVLEMEVENIRRIMKDMIKHGVKLSSL